MIPAAIFLGLAANDFQKHRHALPQPASKERELLSAIRDNGGSITPAGAAMETSLTVSEADRMLSELAGGGHLAVEGREGTLFYVLPRRRNSEIQGGNRRWGDSYLGGSQTAPTGFVMARGIGTVEAGM